jgi:hypothetical protein
MKDELVTRFQDLYRRAKEVMTDDEMMDIKIDVKVPSKPEITLFSFDFNHGEPEIGFEKDGIDDTEAIYGMPLDMFSDEIIESILDDVEPDIEEAELAVEKVFDRNAWSNV